MNASIQNLPIKITVWSEITEGTNNATVLYEETELETPHFLNQRNGFWTYVLTTPINLDAGQTIYIGFTQTDDDVLAIGYDRNRRAEQHLFYNTSGVWYHSLFEGALMMRAVVGEELPEEINVGIFNPKQVEKVFVYPNPADDYLYLQVEGGTSSTVAQLYDFSGRLVGEQAVSGSQINVQDLPTGIYLLRLFDRERNAVGVAKFVKR